MFDPYSINTRMAFLVDKPATRTCSQQNTVATFDHVGSLKRAEHAGGALTTRRRQSELLRDRPANSGKKNQDPAERRRENKVTSFKM